MQVELIVERDQVRLEDQALKRPNSVSRTDWLKFWENAEVYPKYKCADCEEEY